MVELGEKYDVHVLNWHDKALDRLWQSRGSTKRCLMGGLNEEGPLYRGPTRLLEMRFSRRLRMPASALILTPGCVTPRIYLSRIYMLLSRL